MNINLTAYGLDDWFAEDADPKASIKRYMSELVQRIEARYPTTVITCYESLADSISGDIEFWDTDIVEDNITDIREQLLEESHNWGP